MVGNVRKLAKVIRDTSESRRWRDRIQFKKAEILRELKAHGRYELVGPEGRSIVLTSLPDDKNSEKQATR